MQHSLDSVLLFEDFELAELSKLPSFSPPSSAFRTFNPGHGGSVPLIMLSMHVAEEPTRHQDGNHVSRADGLSENAEKKKTFSMVIILGFMII